MSRPVSVGIGPVSWLEPRALRRRGADARRFGRRGRGGASQPGQRREQADLSRDRALDLVVVEPPAPRGRSRAASGVGDAGGARSSVSAVSRPITVGTGLVIWLFSRYLRRRRAVARRAGSCGRGGSSQGLQLRELADLGRDRAVDLVVVEPPAPRGRSRAAPGVGGAGGNPSCVVVLGS